ncbi:hypothetical protein [Cesiribacter sp. SM1]|uniref:hypothetical protein n=1 Tax=Cesiribacter sp. SM1 TaxID=2861196 RepID=UPI001CD7A0C9|nr:hypothetical protein [Cesiribacter sp. SM1]
MKTILIYLLPILLLGYVDCLAQTNPADIKSETEPKFKNQGEQEDYWAKELFEKKYKKQVYPRFKRILITEKDNVISFGPTTIELLTNSPDLLPIFTTGLFYPRILDSHSLRISDLEELKFLSDSPTVKRFRFWLYHPNRANPQVYFFELTNEKADENTDIKAFIEGASLTFVKDGWIIL